MQNIAKKINSFKWYDGQKMTKILPYAAKVKFEEHAVLCLEGLWKRLWSYTVQYYYYYFI